MQLSFKTKFYVLFQEADAAKHKFEIKQAALQMLLTHVNILSYMNRHEVQWWRHTPTTKPSHNKKPCVKWWNFPITSNVKDWHSWCNWEIFSTFSIYDEVVWGPLPELEKLQTCRRATTNGLVLVGPCCRRRERRLPGRTLPVCFSLGQGMVVKNLWGILFMR